MTPKHISSRDNASFKRLRELNESGRARRKENRTVLDGMHLVECYAARCGAPELVAVSEHGLEVPQVQRFVERHPDVPVLVMSDALFRDISPVDTPTGVLALVAIPPVPPLALRGKSCVVLDAVQDAGNVGSVIRSAAAAGVGHVILGAGCAQAWSPRVLRAAMGGHFSLHVHEHADLARALADYEGPIVATRLDAPKSIYQLDLCHPVAWLMGNEGAGLSPQASALATVSARIPMASHSESLNVAAAAAVCLFEERRQKSLNTRGGPA